MVASLATKLGSHLDMCTCARADGPLSNVGEPRRRIGTGRVHSQSSAMHMVNTAHNEKRRRQCVASLGFTSSSIVSAHGYRQMGTGSSIGDGPRLSLRTGVHRSALLLAFITQQHHRRCSRPAAACSPACLRSPARRCTRRGSTRWPRPPPACAARCPAAAPAPASACPAADTEQQLE